MRSSQGLGQISHIIPNPALPRGVWDINAGWGEELAQGKAATLKPAPGEPKTLLLMLALTYFGFFEWCLWWLMEFIKPVGGRDRIEMATETWVYAGMFLTAGLLRLVFRWRRAAKAAL